MKTAAVYHTTYSFQTSFQTEGSCKTGLSIGSSCRYPSVKRNVAVINSSISNPNAGCALILVHDIAFIGRQQNEKNFYKVKYSQHKELPFSVFMPCTSLI